jgi:hypothetical protein
VSPNLGFAKPPYVGDGQGAINGRSRP